MPLSGSETMRAEGATLRTISRVLSLDAPSMIMCSHGHVCEETLVRQSAIVAAELYVAVTMEMEGDCMVSANRPVFRYMRDLSISIGIKPGVVVFPDVTRAVTNGLAGASSLPLSIPSSIPSLISSTAAHSGNPALAACRTLAVAKVHQAAYRGEDNPRGGLKRENS